MNLTDLIKTLKELDEKATKGPWKPIADNHRGDGSYTLDSWFARGPQHCETKRHLKYGKAQKEQASKDAQLIAQTRNLMPEIIRWLEAIGEVIEAAEKNNDYATMIQSLGFSPIPADLVDKFYSSKKVLEEALTKLKKLGGE